MVAAMAFPTRYNYLSRIGALSPMPINALLRLGIRTVIRARSSKKDMRRAGLDVDCVAFETN
jgi:hypothetical protein